MLRALLLLPAAAAVWTRSLGGDAARSRFNVALARLNATHFLSTRNVQRLRWTRDGTTCRDAKVVVATVARWTLEDVTSVDARDPLRKCLDRRNFRVNGPEDARLLRFQSTFLVIYAEHVGSARRQFIRVLHDDMSLAPAQELTYTNLNSVEKNWVPFLDRDGRVHVWRWLEDDQGQAVAHALNVGTGALGAPVAQPSRLRGVVGPLKATLSGGTPAISLNATHRVAFGHVARHRRYYTIFAYVFEAASPFLLVAASPEFRFHGMHDASALDFDVTSRPPVEDRIQFPVGLAADGEALLVSWGRDRNRETRVSRVAVGELGLVRLPPHISRRRLTKHVIKRHRRHGTPAKEGPLWPRCTREWSTPAPGAPATAEEAWRVARYLGGVVDTTDWVAPPAPIPNFTGSARCEGNTELRLTARDLDACAARPDGLWTKKLFRKASCLVMAYAAAFRTNASLRWRLRLGDSTHLLGGPFLTKARRIGDTGPILLPLGLDRHRTPLVRMFEIEKSLKPYVDRAQCAMWRGTTTGGASPANPRFQLVWRYGRGARRVAGVRVDVGFDHVVTDALNATRYVKRRVPMDKMAKCKYVLSNEGNDVATGLKWQLFTDSLVLMPAPTKESWLLEGQLRPMVHYVPVRRDWSDLEARLTWCERNQAAAANISRRATAHVRRVLGASPPAERRVVAAVLHGFRQALQGYYSSPPARLRPPP